MIDHAFPVHRSIRLPIDGLHRAVRAVFLHLPRHVVHLRAQQDHIGILFMLPRLRYRIRMDVTCIVSLLRRCLHRLSPACSCSCRQRTTIGSFSQFSLFRRCPAAMALLLFGQCHLHGQQAPFDFILALFSSIRNENPVSAPSVTAVSPAGKTGEIPFYFAFFACMVPLFII